MTSTVAAWKERKNLQLIVTDGCPGLANAIQTVYPRVAHQRCWVHKMRNILEKVRRSDHDAVKADAQAIYLAESPAQALSAFRNFRAQWTQEYGSMVNHAGARFTEVLLFFYSSQAFVAQIAYY